MVKKRRKNSILNEFTNEGLMVIGLMGAAVVTFVCLIVLFFGFLYNIGGKIIAIWGVKYYNNKKMR